jgi:TRAP-type C4-dicarboxylate transport system substrate-binding protein
MKVIQIKTWLTVLLVIGLMAGAAINLSAADNKVVRLKLATIAPRDSSFHRSLVAMGEKWRKASGGAVQLTIYPDGTQGSEADTVGLMQTHTLDAALLTVVGLSDVEPNVGALQNMPMSFRSLDEVDYVGEKLRPQLEQSLLAKGYIVLFWGDSGWVRFFTTTPILHPDDLKKLKLFTWAGSAREYDLWKHSGFNPVALETANIGQALVAGTISAVPVPPIYALAGQIYTGAGKAKYMLELNWAPLVGAAVVRKEAWERVPPQVREEMLKIAAETGKDVKFAGRTESDAAVAAMVKRGLVVQKVPPEVEVEWRAMADSVKDQIRGVTVPPAMFDEAQRLLREYRQQARAQAQGEKGK